MKKVIKLTESDLERIVKKILQEQSILTEIESDAEDLDGSQETVNTEITSFNQVAPLDQKQNMMAIQRKLKSLGYNLGKFGPNGDGIDGNYGRRTLAAIKNFQSRNNIRATGWVGSKTAPLLGVAPMEGNKISGVKKRKPTNVIPKSSAETNKNKLITKKSSDSLSQNIDTNFKSKFNINKLSSDDSTWVCKAGQKSCGQFVNDFSKKLSYVGDAWLAHDLDKAGKRVFSTYTSLSPKDVEKVFNIFKQIEKQGGPSARKSGGQVENIKALQQQLIKPISASDLKVDDIVGIYYPSSPHHEEAFHAAGKPYFVSDGKGGWKKGNTIAGGRGFGMNTHVGIVGGVKNGVPLIFHNIEGDVWSDPYNDIRGGGKIMWIKRN
jgi:peptidoglycan hydrolase-like protein with peptidoglycan-binding domain